MQLFEDRIFSITRGARTLGQIVRTISADGSLRTGGFQER